MLSSLLTRARRCFIKLVSKTGAPKATYENLDAVEPVDRLICCQPNLHGTLSDIVHGYFMCDRVSGLDCTTSLGLRPHPIKNSLFTSQLAVHFDHTGALETASLYSSNKLPPFAYAGFGPLLHSTNDWTSGQECSFPQPSTHEVSSLPTPPDSHPLHLAYSPFTIGLPPRTEPSAGLLYPSCGYLPQPGTTILDDHRVPEDTSCIVEHNDVRFKVTGQLGVGGFGRVVRATLLPWEGVEVAIKVMHKDWIYRHSDGRDMVMKEREAMKRIMEVYSWKSTGLAKLVRSWDDEKNIYFVLPLYGADLWTLVGQRDLTLSRYMMKYITAELILAVANMHSLGIMHRDIKPTNILVDSDGHLVLADFGLAYTAPPGVDLTSLKFRIVCGTEVYEAPEMIAIHESTDEDLSYTCAVDVWAMGLVIYEIAVGSLDPWFHSQSREETRKRILAGSEEFAWETVESYDPLLADLLRRMLDHSQQRRITAEQAKLHPYFRNVHWGLLAQGWIPGVEDDAGPIYPVPPSTSTSISLTDFHQGLAPPRPDYSDAINSEGRRDAAPSNSQEVHWQREMDRREPRAYEFICPPQCLDDIFPTLSFDMGSDSVV